MTQISATEAVGRTIVSVETKTMYARDVTYGEWISLEQTTLTLDGGNTVVFGESTAEYWDDSVTDESPFEEEPHEQ